MPISTCATRDQGLSNGNPVRALIEDGLPGANIAQIGLATFANTAAMHRDALAAGNLVMTIGEIRRERDRGGDRTRARHMSPIARRWWSIATSTSSTARNSRRARRAAGGMAVERFLHGGADAGREPRVRVIDLTEWDPPLDPTDLSALTAARWLAECLPASKCAESPLSRGRVRTGCGR